LIEVYTDPPRQRPSKLKNKDDRVSLGEQCRAIFYYRAEQIKEHDLEGPGTVSKLIVNIKLFYD